MSHFQGNELLANILNFDHIDFIICKATEGTGYIDPKFENNWTLIAKSNKIRGAYHFYRSQDDAEKQALFFYQSISNYSEIDLPLICDFEEAGIDKSQSKNEVISRLKLFLNKIQKLSGVIPIIYTDNNVASEYLTDSYFANYPLWIAEYSNSDQPRIPIIWKDKGWRFWQKSADYNLDSIKNDLDVFNGDLRDLKNFISKAHEANTQKR